MKEIRDTNDMPDFTKTTTGMSVGFHVRRGNKIISESRKFLGHECVRKLTSLQMKGIIVAKPIEHCFIALNDYHETLEVKQALMNYKISCAAHALT